MDQTVEKTIDRLSDLLDRANKAAQDLEVKDRLTDAVAALRRTRLTQDEDAGIERFVTGLLIGVAVGFGLALLLAPKSGEEMRDDLMQRGIELRDRAGELASKMPFGDGEQGRPTQPPSFLHVDVHARAHCHRGVEETVAREISHRDAVLQEVPAVVCGIGLGGSERPIASLPEDDELTV